MYRPFRLASWQSPYHQPPFCRTAHDPDESTSLSWSRVLNLCPSWWTVIESPVQYTDSTRCRVRDGVSQLPPRLRFSNIFPKRLGFSVQILYACYTFLSTLDCKFLVNNLQLWLSYAILTKCDHPACVTADSRYFEHMMVVALNMA